MPIPEPAEWAGGAVPRLPCPNCSRPLSFRQPLSFYLLQCPACGRNPVLFFTGCDEGAFLGEKLALLLSEHRVLAPDALEDLLEVKRDASPRGLLSFALAAGFVREADLLTLAHRLLPPPWRHALEALTGTRPGPTRLQQVLEKNGLLAPEQMHRALEVQRQNGGPLGKTLIELGYLRETQLLEALAEDLRMPFVNLDTADIPSEVLGEVSPTIARLYEAIPVELKAGILTVAVADPLNGSVLEDLEFLLARQVRGAVASPEAVRRALERHYGAPRFDEADEFAAEGRELPIVERHLGFLVLLLLRRPHHRLILTLEPGKNRMVCGPPGALTALPPPPERIVPALAARLKTLVGMGQPDPAAAEEEGASGEQDPTRQELSGTTTLNVQGRSGRLLVVYRREGAREEIEVRLETLPPRGAPRAQPSNP
ncbi:MAG: hypothetical protein HYZ53_02615 [Planctomycetes bacterium]|nr:hypothetical protein [Planctomycetota bacterium]